METEERGFCVLDKLFRLMLCLSTCNTNGSIKTQYVMLKDEQKKENALLKKSTILFYEDGFKDISLKYEFIKLSDEQLNKAFDILFEETMKQGNS